MKAGNYDIVHSHLLFYNGIVMRAAYKAGVRKRIAQSHATRDNRSKADFKSLPRRFISVSCSAGLKDVQRTL